MKFWKVEIKYSRIAIPSIALFSHESEAILYKEQADKSNAMIRWTDLEKVEIEIKSIPMTE